MGYKDFYKHCSPRTTGAVSSRSVGPLSLHVFTDKDTNERNIEFQFITPHGTGSSNIRVCIMPDDFGPVIKAMLEANEIATVEAFAEAVSSRPQRSKNLNRKLDFKP